VAAVVAAAEKMGEEAARINYNICREQQGAAIISVGSSKEQRWRWWWRWVAVAGLEHTKYTYF